MNQPNLSADQRAMLASYDNRIGWYQHDGLTFQVRVVEAQLRYGAVYLRVRPTVGEGAAWVKLPKIVRWEEPA